MKNDEKWCTAAWPRPQVLLQSPQSCIGVAVNQQLSRIFNRFNSCPPSLPRCSRDYLIWNWSTVKSTSQQQAKTSTARYNDAEDGEIQRLFLQTGNHCRTVGICLPAKRGIAFKQYTTDFAGKMKKATHNMAKSENIWHRHTALLRSTIWYDMTCYRQNDSKFVCMCKYLWTTCAAYI